MAWAKNGTPDTLSSSAAEVAISDLTAKKFNQFMIHTLATGGQVDCKLDLDDITATDYAKRDSFNGGADSTATSATLVDQTLTHVATGESYFAIHHLINIDSEEKLGISHAIWSEAAGATAAPSRHEGVYKLDTTTSTSQITKFRFFDTDSGSFNTSSNISALGTN